MHNQSYRNPTKTKQTMKTKLTSREYVTPLILITTLFFMGFCPCNIRRTEQAFSGDA